MSPTTAAIVLLVIALVAANLPWLSSRVFFVGRPPARGKKEWVRLLEWAALAGVVGLMAAGLESRVMGQVYEQDWEFWVVNLCLFAIMALPGFIYHHDLRRYLRKR
ncbi:MAG: DUF2818 family protein [Ectothiorhodospiraceae bacterium]